MTQHPNTTNKRKPNHPNTPPHTFFTTRTNPPPILSSLLDQRYIPIPQHPTHESQKRNFNEYIKVAKMLEFVIEDQGMEEDGRALEAEGGFVDEEEEAVVDGVERVFAQGTGGLVC
jgi:hypothetical protein